VLANTYFVGAVFDSLEARQNIGVLKSKGYMLRCVALFFNSKTGIGGVRWCGGQYRVEKFGIANGEFKIDVPT
jgi:hypothetical protein